MNNKVTALNPTQAQNTPKCPFTTVTVQDPKTGAISLMGADGFCMACRFHNKTFGKCLFDMLFDKMLFNK